MKFATQISPLLNSKINSIFSHIVLLHHFQDSNLQSLSTEKILIALRDKNKYDSNDKKLHFVQSFKIKIFRSNKKKSVKMST